MEFSPSSSGVIRYLAQHGAAGLVSCFGSVHGIPCQRGEQVVVQTSRGAEMARVLQTGDIQQPPTGELLRKATAADISAHTEASRLAAEILADAQRKVEEHALPLVIVDAEVLLNHDVAICYYLGDADIRLGPIAFDLGRQQPPLRVQFEPVATTGASLPSAASATPAVDEPPPLPPDTTWRERLKHESNMLRGNIAAELNAAQAVEGEMPASFTRETARLLEFHGVYQQAAEKTKKAAHNRDQQRRLMVRVNPPGGALSSTQLLAMFEMATQYGDGTLRITTRQGLQFHGVLQGRIQTLLQELNDRLISTFGACGDATRNIVCCPAPDGGSHRKLQQAASSLARQLMPSPAAYHEIWLGEPHNGAAMEPLYGAAYLPQKLKFAFAAADHNCVDLLTHDVGFLADEEDGRLAGFHCVVGGGLATKPRDDESFAALAQPLGYVPAGEVAAVAAAILQLHRDHGRRDKHHFGRLRYLIHDWGIDRFRDELCSQLAPGVLQQRDFTLPPANDHLGWHETSQGCYAGIHVPAGRIQKELLAGFAGLLQAKSRRIRLTPTQNLIVGDLEPSHREEFNFDQLNELPGRTLACPSLPTCKLATGEAERVSHDLAVELQKLIAGLDLSSKQVGSITLRISGCYNACSHPQTAAIGLIATGKTSYDLTLGGDAAHLGFVHAKNIAFADIPTRLARVLKRFSKQAESGETFAAFCRRCEAELRG